MSSSLAPLSPRLGPPQQRHGLLVGEHLQPRGVDAADLHLSLHATTPRLSWRCRADFPPRRAFRQSMSPARRFLSSVPAAAPVSEAMCKNSAKKTAAAL